MNSMKNTIASLCTAAFLAGLPPDSNAVDNHSRSSQPHFSPLLSIARVDNHKSIDIRKIRVDQEKISIIHVDHHRMS